MSKYLQILEPIPLIYRYELQIVRSRFDESIVADDPADFLGSSKLPFSALGGLERSRKARSDLQHLQEGRGF